MMSGSDSATTSFLSVRGVRASTLTRSRRTTVSGGGCCEHP
ncbi:hypothetical protein [Halovenus carboxidivorans]|nr:hypothetical protein [Halovenus carboxidivorans]